MAFSLFQAVPVAIQGEVAPAVPEWSLGVHGGGAEGGERGLMKMYEYEPEGPSSPKHMPDVTVSCAKKELLVEPIPADWKPEDGYEPERLPVWQITFANPEGPDHDGNTDFETIGTAIDRGDAVKFRFEHDTKAFSVCAERPGSFDICCKVYPNGLASGHFFHMGVGDQIDCYVHRKSSRVSRERRGGSHVGAVTSKSRLNLICRDGSEFREIARDHSDGRVRCRYHRVPADGGVRARPARAGARAHPLGEPRPWRRHVLARPAGRAAGDAPGALLVRGDLLP